MVPRSAPCARCSQITWVVICLGGTPSGSLCPPVRSALRGRRRRAGPRWPPRIGCTCSSESPPGADVWWLRVGAGVAGLLFARSIMTPTATKATHSDAAAVPSPMTQGRGRTDRGSQPSARTSSRSRCAKAQLEPSSRMHCRRYPRLDFFRFADLPVGRRSAARRHAASRTKLVASSGPRHIPSSQPCRGCESTLSEPTLLLGCYRR
jgi:hypothetical protein